MNARSSFRTIDLTGDIKRLPVYRLRLQVIRGPDCGLSCEVEAPNLTIGSSTSCDLSLNDRAVSRHHCKLYVRGSLYVVCDENSRNGVYIKGIRIMEAAISPSTIISVGRTELLFEPRCDDLLVMPYNDDEFSGMRGRSKVMNEVFGLIHEVAPSNLTCLLIGETGTGKELAAKAIHNNSKRAEKPFLVVDCAAVGRQFIEDKLFGHTQGAYTGADKARPGVFEEANGGTVFLDEIGELPLELQPKLLRVLERREVTRIGSHRSTNLNVRIVAATHRDLAEMVREGTFREDLFYRLAEIPIPIPPLRERLDDIELIVDSILHEEGQAQRSLAHEGLEYLKRRDWPGNIRELRNLIRRASALAKSDIIDAQLLELMEVRHSLIPNISPNISLVPKSETEESLIGAEFPLNEATDLYRKEYVAYLRERFGNDLSRAAEHAGLHPKSISRLFKQYGVYDI